MNLISYPKITEIVQQFFRFAVVGGTGTSFHFLILIILVRLAGSDPVMASIWGSIGGALVNYILNYHWTFKSNKLHRKALPMFLMVAFSCLALNAAIMTVIINIYGIQYILSQIIATAIVLLWNFGANKAWTFKQPVI